jgi:hypothetical protein
MRRRHARRRLAAVSLLAVLVAVAAYALTSGGASHASRASAVESAAASPARSSAPAAAAAPAPPALQVRAPRAAYSRWTVAARVHGQPAVWVAERAGVTLMRMNQQLVHLTLHAGSSDGGVAGWTYGDEVTPSEIHHLVAAFNGAFKLTSTGVGFSSGSHVAVALKPGLASLVTYTDGTSDIGAWGAGVPSPARRVFSVLQNQRLLVDQGRAAANVSTCIIECWGATIGGQTTVARSSIGVTSGGELVWAAGEQLTPSQLADALIGAGAVRAMELDINPDWVAGYLYEHHPGGPAPVPLIPGQLGIYGKLLEPYSRDFLAVIANA